MIATNFDNVNSSHIINFNRLVELGKILYNSYQTRKLIDILWTKKIFLLIKMEERDDLIAHMNKIKVYKNQLVDFDKLVNNRKIELIFMRLSKSYNYHIVALKFNNLKELIINYIMSNFIYDVIKKKWTTK